MSRKKGEPVVHEGVTITPLKSGSRWCAWYAIAGRKHITALFDYEGEAIQRARIEVNTELERRLHRRAAP